MPTLLSIITLAVLCGNSGHRSIASFAQKLTKSQRRNLRCPRDKDGNYRVPKETCIRNILENLDAESFENVVIQWMAGLDDTELRAIAVDGKTLKGTGSRNEEGIKKGALHLVSAVSHDNTRLIAQEAVEDKSNEIPAVQRLIERLPHLDGITVTSDAMNTQNDTARLIRQKKGSLQFQAKRQSAHYPKNSRRLPRPEIASAARSHRNNPLWRPDRNTQHLDASR